jgi:hypothetical protein
MVFCCGPKLIYKNRSILEKRWLKREQRLSTNPVERGLHAPGLSVTAADGRPQVADGRTGSPQGGLRGTIRASSPSPQKGIIPRRGSRDLDVGAPLKLLLRFAP